MTPEEIERLQTPTWEQAKAAIRGNDPDGAVELIDRAVAQWRSLQEYSINWVTALLSYIGRELGEAAVEDALRDTGERFVRPRRDSGVEWASLPADVRAKVIARAMVANFGTVAVDEDEEKITLSFDCGSGGQLIDDGRYEGEHAYLTLTERSPRTFMQDALPVYCAHCSVNNEIQAIEWGGTPTSIEYPQRDAGGRCVHHVYKDVAAIPAEAYERIGKRKPES
ncbi:MAG: hypothetical protein JWO37_3220 [Acidimicrobiales bacterium]|jgi:hypothetical protein|nr:hypothetical protein [Acidimicrobiales bacterium]